MLNLFFSIIAKLLPLKAFQVFNLRNWAKNVWGWCKRGLVVYGWYYFWWLREHWVSLAVVSLSRLEVIGVAFLQLRHFLELTDTLEICFLKRAKMLEHSLLLIRRLVDYAFASWPALEKSPISCADAHRRSQHHRLFWWLKRRYLCAFQHIGLLLMSEGEGSLLDIVHALPFIIILQVIFHI